MVNMGINEWASVGYVYACKYDCGLLKVGMSGRDPEARIKAHDRSMDIAGSSRIDTYISHKIVNARGIEGEIIRVLADKHPRKAREWFEGGSVIDAIEVVERLAEDVEDTRAVQARDVSRQRAEGLVNTIMAAANIGAGNRVKTGYNEDDMTEDELVGKAVEILQDRVSKLTAT